MNDKQTKTDTQDTTGGKVEKVDIAPKTNVLPPASAPKKQEEKAPIGKITSGRPPMKHSGVPEANPQT